MRLRSKRRPPATPFVSVFDLFRIGIGPSSSHTVGPMRAARMFVALIGENVNAVAPAQVTCDLFGSLALTGVGHGTDTAVIVGLLGETPEGIDPDKIPELVETVRSEKRFYT